MSGSVLDETLIKCLVECQIDGLKNYTLYYCK